MIRFRMLSPELDRAARIKELKEQTDAFIRSDALNALLDALDTDIDNISHQYNARAQKGGKVLETQEIASIPELNSRKDELYPSFEELGFFGINNPVSSDYSRILILSASLKTTYLKTVSSANWVTPKVISVDALACFRPINPVERVNTGCTIDRLLNALNREGIMVISMFMHPDKENGEYKIAKGIIEEICNNNRIKVYDHIEIEEKKEWKRRWEIIVIQNKDIDQIKRFENEI